MSRLHDERDELRILDAGFGRSVEALIAAREQLREVIVEAADLMTTAFVRERVVLAAGNGGSAAQAQHLAAELVGRFKLPGRPALPVIPLCADTATMTAWANDVGFDDVFARGVEAFGRPGDLLVGFSTSGRSLNLLRAFEAARARGLDTLALLGGDGGELLALADLAIVVPSSDTQSIQDVQGTVVHLLCELVEQRLAEGGWFSQARGLGARLRPVGPGLPSVVGDGDGQVRHAREAYRWPTR